MAGSRVLVSWIEWVVGVSCFCRLRDRGRGDGVDGADGVDGVCLIRCCESCSVSVESFLHRFWCMESS